MTTSNYLVGDANNPDGSTPQARGGRQGEAIGSNLRGFYAEQTARNRVFSLVLNATTTNDAAGNIVAAAAAASTQFALWNPLGSGVNLELLKVFIGIISGTPPGGPVFHGIIKGGALPTIANSGTVNCNMIGSNAVPKAGYLASAAGAALTGCANGPTLLRPIGIDFSASSFAAAAGQSAAMEILDGDIILTPGTGWVPLWAAAGTSLLNSYGVTWAEVPQ